MSRENKFGKWGAWVAAGVMAVGGQEIMMNESKQETTVASKENDGKKFTKKETPVNNDSGKSTNKPENNIFETNKKMQELKKRDLKKFLDQTNQELYSKLTPKDIEQLMKDSSFEDEDLLEFHKKQQTDDSRYREKGNEYAKNDQQFNHIKKILEAKYPNSVISVHRYFNDDGDEMTDFYIKQQMLVKNLAGIDFRIDFTIDKNGFNVNPRSTAPWSASDEKTFFETLEKNIKLTLLKKYFTSQNSEGEINDEYKSDAENENPDDTDTYELGEKKIDAQFVMWLKLYGLFEEFKDLL